MIAVPRRLAGDGHYGQPSDEGELWDLFHRARASVDGTLDDGIWVVGADGRTRGRVLEIPAAATNRHASHEGHCECDRTRLASVA